MMKPIPANGHLKIIAALGFFLFFISILIHLTGDFNWYRFFRAIISFSFLGIIIYFRRLTANPFLLLFFIFYGLSSFLTLWYENTSMAITSLFFNFISFLFLIIALWQKVSFKKAGTISKSVFVLLMLVNAYLLYEFVNMLRDFTQSTSHYAIMLLGAMSLIIVAMLSLLYNDRCSTKNSLVFTLAIFTLIFAEIFRAMGYYDIDFGNISVYIARFLLILASGLLANFAISSKTEKEKLGRKLF